ncbi:MAG: DUF4465 domain-containing protein [Pirellula sp.]
MPLARDLRAPRDFVVLLCFLLFPSLLCRGDIIGFEDNSLYSQGSSGLYYNGDLGNNTTNNQGWKSGGVGFSNSYTFDNQNNYGYWSGFSYSRVNAGNVSGFQNQYAAKPGTGSGGSAHYAIAYNSFVGDSIITFGAQVQVASIDITNTAYAYFSMKEGDQFSKKFGGDSGNDPDFFKLRILGFQGATQTAAVDFFLADYRSDNNSQDYVVDQWTRVDLASLGAIDSLKFALLSTDNGQFGMNTPAYFAMDRIEFSAVPEPGSVALLSIAALGWWVRKRTLRR